MAYEIPTQIAYKEKILFGLTFEQLVIASIFLVPALALPKQPKHKTPKFTL